MTEEYYRASVEYHLLRKHRKMPDNAGRAIISTEIRPFMQNPLYPDHFEISTKIHQEHQLGVPYGIKKYIVSGAPVECTIECDYSTINVSGNSHGLYIIGIRNQVNLIGTSHSIFFEGFHNQVNYCTDVPDGQALVKGDNPLSFQIGLANGKIISNNSEPSPTKLVFSSSLKDRKRLRLSWRAANQPTPIIQLSKDEDSDSDENM